MKYSVKVLLAVVANQNVRMACTEFSSGIHDPWRMYFVRTTSECICTLYFAIIIQWAPVNYSPPVLKLRLLPHGVLGVSTETPGVQAGARSDGAPTASSANPVADGWLAREMI